MRMIVILAGLVPMISGCAALNTRSIAYEKASASQLFVWRSDFSAGIGQNGQMCAQAATTARATGVSAETTVNSAVVSAIAPHLKDLPPQEAARMAASLQQSVMLTNATNGQTAYANIAYFYLCQISLNAQNKLSAADIRQMWTEIAQTVPKVGISSVETSKLDASAPGVPPRDSGAEVEVPTDPHRSTENSGAPTDVR